MKQEKLKQERLENPLVLLKMKKFLRKAMEKKDDETKRHKKSCPKKHGSKRYRASRFAVIFYFFYILADL